MKVALVVLVVMLGVVGCRTANVQVLDAVTHEPIAGASVRPRYLSLIMGHTVTELGAAKLTDQQGKARFHTHLEQEFSSFYVDGTSVDHQAKQRRSGSEFLLFVERK